VAKTIQIRNVPDEVHAELKARAAANGQSLSAYVLEHVNELASRPTIADVLKRGGARFGPGVTTKMIVDAIRGGRGE
jgi:hypothetical protein